MSDDRKYPVSLVLNGEMYVMGGYNDNAGWLDSVDYKPAGQCEFQPKQEWRMLRGMYNFCAVGHQNKIYTIGTRQQIPFRIDINIVLYNIFLFTAIIDIFTHF